MHADEKQQQTAEPVLRLVDHTIQSVRRIATELRTGVLDHLGNEIVIDPERATAIFRIFQESLTNIARHANASQVDIRLSEDHGDVVLQVRDNGRGIGEEQVTTAKSVGILGTQERAHLLGGELTISGSAERGTMVRVRIPEAGK
jgi:signal transduction histidine kinase